MMCKRIFRRLDYETVWSSESASRFEGGGEKEKKKLALLKHSKHGILVPSGTESKISAQTRAWPEQKYDET